MIGDSIRIMVVEIRGDKVRLGIDAPKQVPVHRQEIYDAIQRAQIPKLQKTGSQAMKSVMRWQLEVMQAPQAIEMPKGAEILDIQALDNKPTIWALCDAHAELEQRRFRIVSTGLLCDLEGAWYHGTFQLAGGGYVGHVFEVTDQYEKPRSESADTLQMAG